MANRDFSAELQAAREAQDWAAHAAIWEDRRLADVAEDEAALEEYWASQSDPSLTAFELRSDAGRPEYSPEVYDEMVRHDAEGRT